MLILLGLLSGALFFIAGSKANDVRVMRRAKMLSSLPELPAWEHDTVTREFDLSVLEGH